MITYVILGAFLLGTLALGLWAGKDVKTMKDYVLANRSLSTAVVTMSLVATVIASGDLQSPYHVFNYGVSEIIITICFALSFLIVGWLIAPNMVYFQGCLTTGDLMHKFYGNGIRIFTGIINIYFSLLLINSQLRAIGYIASDLLNLSAEWTILGVGLLVVLYTCMSGMRGVAYTDVLQLICVLSILVVITYTLLYKLGGIQNLFQQLPSEKLSFSNEGITSIWRRLKAGTFFAISLTYLLSPPNMHRMLMLQNPRQVQGMFFSGVTIYAVIRFMLWLIGLGAVVYFANSPFHLAEVKNAKNLLAYVVSHLFFNNQFMQLLVFIAFLFIIISTIDSFLHSAGITLIHDIIKPFTNKKKIVINEIKWARSATFLIGIIAVLISFTNIYSNFRFWGDTVVLSAFIIMPLVAGIMGLKTNKISFLLFCMTLGISMLTFFPLLGGDQKDPHGYLYNVFFISIGIATLLFFISHYIINKGFVTVQRTHHTTAHKLWRPSWRSLITIFTSHIPTPSKLAKLAQRKISNYGSEPFLFSIFFICASPIILLNIPQAPATIPTMALVFGIAITLCCGLMLEVKWLPSLKSYFSLYWFFTLLYCLPFAGTLLFLTHAENSTAMVSLGLAWFLLMLCVDWKSFFILALLGTSVASGVYGYVTGSFWPMMDFDMKWNFYLAVMAILTACFLFAQRKELYNKVQLQKANLYAGSIAHETKNYLDISRFAGWRINEAVQKKQLKALEEGDLYTIPKQLAEDLMFLGPELEEGANQGLSKINMFMSALKENIISAKISVSSIKACVEEALKDGYFKDKEVSKGLLLKLDDDFKAKVPEGFFKHVIYNLVKNAYWHGGATEVVITLDAAKRSLSVEDNGVGIDSTSLPYVFDLFYSGGSGSGIGLALVRLIVEAFGGSVHCASKQEEESYTRFTVCFGEGV